MTSQSKRMDKILMDSKLGSDGIYSSKFSNSDQKEEIAFRKTIGNLRYDNFLETLSQHHSIPVMDREVRRILKKTTKKFNYFRYRWLLGMALVKNCKGSSGYKGGHC